MTSEPLDSPAILLVEDDEMIRPLLERQLGAHYSVVACSDAETALDAARQHDFDLVLLDISLPGISGLEAVRQLRAMSHYVRRPIVALTGFALPEDIRLFREAGFSHTLEKPFTPRQLMSLIDELLAK